MNQRIPRFWAAMALYGLGIVLRGGVVGPLWLACAVLLVLNEVRPAWFNPPRWLRRPEIGVVSTLVFALGALFAQEWDLDAWVWLAATALFVADARARGELAEAPRMFRELRVALRAPEAPVEGAGSPTPDPTVRKRAKIALGICFASLFLTWAPYYHSGFVTWERTGTLYVDGAGRTVEDRTWNSPRWNDTSSPSSTGLGLGQGPLVALTVLGAAAVLFTRRYENPRLRDLTFKVAAPVLLLCTYANGYAADALGWWVYVAGVGLFLWSAWQNHAASRAAAAHAA